MDIPRSEGDGIQFLPDVWHTDAVIDDPYVDATESGPPNSCSKAARIANLPRGKLHRDTLGEEDPHRGDNGFPPDSDPVLRASIRPRRPLRSKPFASGIGRIAPIGWFWPRSLGAWPDGELRWFCTKGSATKQKKKGGPYRFDTGGLPWTGHSQDSRSCKSGSTGGAIPLFASASLRQMHSLNVGGTRACRSIFRNCRRNGTRSARSS